MNIKKKMEKKIIDYLKDVESIHLIQLYLLLAALSFVSIGFLFIYIIYEFINYLF
jgi:hypothetical protein